MILKLAFSGCLRYQRRLKNLTAALTIVFILSFFFISLFTSLNSNLRDYWVGNYIGGDLIANKGEKFFDLTKPIKFENYINYNDFISENRALEKFTSPRIRCSVRLEGDNLDEIVARPVIMTGLDYEKEKLLNDFITIEEGRMFNPGSREVILPQSVASDLGANIGEKVYAFATTIDSYSNAEALEVVGFYKTVQAAGFAFGNFYAFMDLSVIQELIQTDLNSEIFIYGDRFVNLKGDYVKNDSIKAISISRTIKMAYDVMFYVVITLLLIFCFGVVLQNITMMNEERKGEIAVYLTYGAKPIWIKSLMLLELVLYILFCSVLGAILSLFLNIWLNSLGLYPVDIFSEILLGGRELVLLRSFPLFVKTWIYLTVLVLVAGYYPINKCVQAMNIIGLFKKE